MEHNNINTAYCKVKHDAHDFKQPFITFVLANLLEF